MSAVETRMEYEAVIGLEVHAQLLTRSKLFCGCSAAFGAPPNTQTCPVCQGMPGVLPVANRRAVEFVIRTALALHCRINPACRFARKHYFYPDMPKNFQISQYEEPLAEDGWLEVDHGGAPRRIGIQRVHLEEDVGKLLHEGAAFETARSSLVDFNRSGVPLMEIVSRPDLRSPEEAAEYLRGLRAILVYLGVSTGNMEEGALRCDANISLRPRGSAELGTKVEIKNMNSFRNVRAALEYEVRRQGRALARGERLVQETRLFSVEQGVTLSMRSKEYAHDYRYFPEPDLVPLRIAPGWVEEIATSLPELPAARRARFMTQHGLPPHDAELLTAERSVADYFEQVLALVPEPRLVSNWITTEVFGRVGTEGKEETSWIQLLPPGRLAGLLRLLEQGFISGRIAKDVLDEMWREPEASAEEIVRKRGWVQVSDESELVRVIEEVLAAHPAAVGDWQKGKKQSLAFLVGQVMKATRGQANPQLVNRLLIERLPPPAGP